MKEELLDILKRAGVKAGDIICVFSDIMSFGIPTMIKKEVMEHGVEHLFDIYIWAFKEAVGVGGLVIMPTFSYSACHVQNYDVEKTPSTVGVLTEYFRKQKDVIRSLHPIFSFAAAGEGAEEFMRLDDSDCFGEGSIFGKLYQVGGKYVLFGVDIQHGASYVYYSEQKMKVYYRYFKEFTGKIKNNGNEYEQKTRYYVRDYNIAYEDHWYDLEKDALREGICTDIGFSTGRILLMGSREIDALIQKKLKENNNYLIRRKQ